jgi:hypothetical protein
MSIRGSEAVSLLNNSSFDSRDLVSKQVSVMPMSDLNDEPNIVNRISIDTKQNSANQYVLTRNKRLKKPERYT